METIALVRPYVEIAYFIAGIFLLVGVAFAWRQALLIRSDMSLRMERASKEKAIEACSKYTDQFVEKSNLAFKLDFEKKYSNYAGKFLGNFTRASLPKEHIDNCVKRYLHHMPALNCLESIAAFFVSGVADEKTGFSIIGRSFCENVEFNYDLISFPRENSALQTWNNIVILYGVWRPRLSRSEIEFAEREAQAALKGFGPDKSINPIGANI